LTLKEVIAKTSHIVGNNTCGEETIGIIYNLAQELPKGAKIVEIGTMFGRSSAVWALSCESSQVYTIDKYDRRFIVDANLAWAKIGNVKLLLGDSKIIPWTERVDCVFIDGSHEYQDVLADIKRWDKFTTKIICGHDYFPTQFPDVVKAVDEYFGDKKQLIGNVNKIWIMRK